MYNKFALKNGLRIVCEKIPFVHSVSIGVWVGCGSRNESLTNNGVSHFIEHMLFKGTTKRSAKEIAETIDNIGGQINAFTGKECTCYYTKTLDTHMEIAMDLLSDMLFNSKLDPKDIEIEKKVILEEISMYEDSPEELVHDILSENVWKNNTLGYPILGTNDSLQAINRDSILEYIGQNYIPNNTVIAIAGNFDYAKLEEIINKFFGEWKASEEQNINFNKAKAEFISNVTIREKDTEQAHICLGFNGYEHGSEKLYTLLAINNIFGGGMSSRLFQRIRESKGLVYSIYSYPSSYISAGLFIIYAGMNPEHVSTVTEMIIDEIQYLKKNSITGEELDKSKEQLKGNFILGLESTSSRMNGIGKSELILGRTYTPEEILKKIDNIKIDDVNEIIQTIFDLENTSFSAVGNLNKNFDFKKLINAD